MLEAERSTAAVFQPLPLRYLEVAHVLLKDAKDTFAADEYWKVRPRVTRWQRLTERILSTELAGARFNGIFK